PGRVSISLDLPAAPATSFAASAPPHASTSSTLSSSKSRPATRSTGPTAASSGRWGSGRDSDHFAICRFGHWLVSIGSFDWAIEILNWDIAALRDQIGCPNDQIECPNDPIEWPNEQSNGPMKMSQCPNRQIAKLSVSARQFHLHSGVVVAGAAGKVEEVDACGGADAAN